MREIELKFQVPPPARAEVLAELHALGAGCSTLRAAYHDTPGRHLARERMALRMRQENGRWVQTLKGLGHHAMERLEDNQHCEAVEGAPPALDPRRHADSVVGQRLLALLAAPDAGGLIETYRTEIERRHAILAHRRGRVELAFDVGRIVAGPRQLEVHELEFELLDGRAWAVLGSARVWVRRHHLWLDLRSKAQMGERLAHPEPQGASPSDRAGGPLLQALALASDIAGGQAGPGARHALREALDGLRGQAGSEDWDQQLRALCGARDLPARLRSPEATLGWLDALAGEALTPGLQ